MLLSTAHLCARNVPASGRHYNAGKEMQVKSAKEILDFWFSDRVRPLWFNSTPEFDLELREQFMPTFQAASQGELDGWQTSPEGALALIIIFDQFPLNMFRRQPESFSTEAVARAVSEAAIAKGFDQHLADEQKAFLYLPFMHSEDLRDQDKSVELFTKAGLIENLKYAEHHRELIRRFKRFPHRNEILGREEIEYLNSKEAFHG